MRTTLMWGRLSTCGGLLTRLPIYRRNSMDAAKPKLKDYTEGWITECQRTAVRGFLNRQAARMRIG